ncbi:MAG: hypothetical protein R2793_04690 [Flavobacteriaceae bacterium]
MKPAQLFIVSFFCLSLTYAQVGINTTSPNALLDIVSTNQASPSATDGILIPKVDNFPLSNPSLNQDGMMVFVTGNGVPLQGFYFWDNANAQWQKVDGELETLDEGNGYGWRFKDSNPSNYGTIGFHAVDLSYSASASSFVGARGNYAFAGGITSRAVGDYSFSYGRNTNANGTGSVALGNGSQAMGSFGTALGSTYAASYAETSLGTYNVIGTGNATAFVSTDPLLVVGNGTSTASRSNALLILKDGTITAPSLDMTEITDSKALITKEFADANYTVETVESPTNATLTASWTNYSSTYENAGYYKHNNRVYLRGLVRNTNLIVGSGSVIFTLPVGYRPSKRKICTGMQNGGIRVDINTNGQVIYMAGDDILYDYFSLEGISFDLF